MVLVALGCLFTGGLAASLAILAATPRSHRLARGGRLAAGLLLASLLVGGPAFGAGILFSSAGRFHLLAAVGAGAAMTAYYALTIRWMHRFTRIVDGLADPDTRPQALLRATAYLERELEGDRLSKVGSRLFVSSSGTLLRLGEHALLTAWCDKIDPAQLLPGQGAVIACNATLAHLALDDLAAARRAHTMAGEVHDRQTYAFLIAADALLTALEGQYVRALELATSEPDQGNVRLASLLLEAQAIAHAGLGRTEDAKNTLRALHEQGGTAALETVVERRSSASPLAHALIESGTSQ